ncbi:MAG: DUF4333 domain-containing protein, partial [Mycobacterium sp.]
QGSESGPDAPWYLRRPPPDDHTRIARRQPVPPRAYPSPPPTPNIPWYLQRPDRPPPSAEHQSPTAATKDTEPVDRRRFIPWLLLGTAGLALLAAIVVLLTNVAELGVGRGAVLDVAKVQAGVLQTLSDPASGYGANTVTDVSCNNGRNPSADKGTAFTCDATVNGAQRHVTVVVSDGNGTYEVDGPR